MLIFTPAVLIFRSGISGNDDRDKLLRLLLFVSSSGGACMSPIIKINDVYLLSLIYL